MVMINVMIVNFLKIKKLLKIKLAINNIISLFNFMEFKILSSSP